MQFFCGILYICKWSAHSIHIYILCTHTKEWTNIYRETSWPKHDKLHWCYHGTTGRYLWWILSFCCSLKTPEKCRASPQAFEHCCASADWYSPPWPKIKRYLLLIMCTCTMHSIHTRLSHILDICLKQLSWVWKICGIGQFEEIIKNFWKISKFKPSSARRKF